MLKQIGSVYSAFKTRSQKSRSFEEDSQNGSVEGRDRRYSVVSNQQFSTRRSHSESPTPHASQNQDNGKHLTLYTLGQIAKFPHNLNLSEHKRTRGLTFKVVVEAIIAFIRQEKLLRLAIGGFKLKQQQKFDLKRLKGYIKRTRAFSAGLSQSKDIELKAPDAAPKRAGDGRMTFGATARNVAHVKNLSKKKGGFIKSATSQGNQEPSGPPSDGHSHTENVQNGRRGSMYPPVGISPQDWDRRYPPDYGSGSGPYDRQPRGRSGYDPREESEYYRWRDHGYDTMRSHSGRGYRDEYYRRDMETNRSRDPRERDWEPNDRGRPPYQGAGGYNEQDYQIAMQEYRDEYENTPHGERYKLAPPDYRRHRDRISPDRYRNRSYSPGEDRYLRLFDSSPEDQERGHTGRDDTGYNSGPSGAPESRDPRHRSQINEHGQRNKRSPENRKSGKRQKSPPRRRRKSGDRKSRDRSFSPQDRTYQDERTRTPEEYKWNKGNRERGLAPADMRRSDYMRTGRSDYMRTGRSDDHGYPSNPNTDRRYPNAREEMAKMHAVAVYAAAMGGVNDEGGWSYMLSWKHRLLHLTAAWNYFLSPVNF